jgi:hypothetical protein
LWKTKKKKKKWGESDNNLSRNNFPFSLFWTDFTALPGSLGRMRKERNEKK